MLCCGILFCGDECCDGRCLGFLVVLGDEFVCCIVVDFGVDDVGDYDCYEWDDCCCDDVVICYGVNLIEDVV